MVTETAKGRAKKTRQDEIDRRGGRCSVCKKHYNKLNKPLECDHRPGTCKIANVSDMVLKGGSDVAILDEMSKCDLVCHPCHNKRTGDRARDKSAVRKAALVSPSPVGRKPSGATHLHKAVAEVSHRAQTKMHACSTGEIFNYCSASNDKRCIWFSWG
jgi:hypothetical protein